MKRQAAAEQLRVTWVSLHEGNCRLTQAPALWASQGQSWALLVSQSAGMEPLSGEGASVPARLPAYIHSNNFVRGLLPWRLGCVARWVQ